MYTQRLLIEKRNKQNKIEQEIEFLTRRNKASSAFIIKQA